MLDVARPRSQESEDEIEVIQQEINVLSQCDCPYVTRCAAVVVHASLLSVFDQGSTSDGLCRYYGSFVQDTALWIVMEYLAGTRARIRSAHMRTHACSRPWLTNLPSEHSWVTE